MRFMKENGTSFILHKHVSLTILLAYYIPSWNILKNLNSIFFIKKPIVIKNRIPNNFGLKPKKIVLEM